MASLPNQRGDARAFPPVERQTLTRGDYPQLLTWTSACLTCSASTPISSDTLWLREDAATHYTRFRLPPATRDQTDARRHLISHPLPPAGVPLYPVFAPRASCGCLYHNYPWRFSLFGAGRGGVRDVRLFPISPSQYLFAAPWATCPAAACASLQAALKTSSSNTQSAFRHMARAANTMALGLHVSRARWDVARVATATTAHLRYACSQ